MANVLRQELGPNVILFGNEACEGYIHGWPKIPASLDYISCDIYNVTNGTAEAETIIQFYDRLLLPRLHAHQQALLVPGTFACETGIGVTRNQSSQTQMVLHKLERLQEYAQSQPKIGGFCE